MDYALNLSGVNKIYDLSNNKAVDNLTLNLKKGEVFGFLGPNGAGKTTTIKMIIGLTYPSSGKISVFNQPAGSIAASIRLGFLPENPVAYSYLNGLEYVSMHGQLCGLKSREAKIKAIKALSSVGLDPNLRRPIGHYSKGMTQRVGLAQCLISNPDLLLLDEPFSGLDVLGRYEIKNLLLKLKKEGKTIFLNSHILSDISEICDSIGILDGGKLISSGKIKDLIKNNQSLESFFVEQIKTHREKKKHA